MERTIKDPTFNIYKDGGNVETKGKELKKEELLKLAKDEADLKNKLIFFQSPIGKGLIGKNKNDLVEINTPAGIKNFEIKDVKYI